MYSMIASLDVGRKQAVLEGYKLLERTVDAGRRIAPARSIRPVPSGARARRPAARRGQGRSILLDRTKITVDISSCGPHRGTNCSRSFSPASTSRSRVTFNTITLLLTIGTTARSASRLYDALMRIAREKTRAAAAVPDARHPGFTELVYLPRDAYYCGGELMPLLDDNDQPNADLVGRTCADQIVPYPPGIPVLVPGQLITESIVEYLIRYLRVQNKVELHGVVYQGYFPSIRVLTASEERRIAVLREPTVARKARLIPFRPRAVRPQPSRHPSRRSSGSVRWCCRM